MLLLSRWNVVIQIDEDYRRTRAVARLRTRRGEQVGTGFAHRHPTGPDAPGTGDERAAAAALADLADRLVTASAEADPAAPAGDGLDDKPAPHDSKRWTVVVDIANDHGAVRALARLHDRTSDRLEGEGIAHVVPVQRPASELGAGPATSRALRCLAERLAAGAGQQAAETRPRTVLPAARPPLLAGPARRPVNAGRAALTR